MRESFTGLVPACRRSIGIGFRSKPCASRLQRSIKRLFDDALLTSVSNRNERDAERAADFLQEVVAE